MKLNLKENTKYRTRAGGIVTVKRFAIGIYPYKGSNGYSYTSNGEMYIHHEDSDDIIEEIKEEKQMKIEIGKLYLANNGGTVKITGPTSNGNYSGFFIKGGDGGISWGYYSNGTLCGFGKDHAQSLVSEVVEDSIRNVLPPTFAVEVPNERISKIIQERFFEQGIYWGSGEKKYLPLLVNYNVLSFEPFEIRAFRQSTKKYWEENKKSIVTLEDFLSFDIPKPPKSFKLNEKYTATIRDGYIEVNGVGRIEAAAVKAIVDKSPTDFPEKFFVRTPTQKLFEAVKEKIGEIKGIDHTQKDYYSDAVGCSGHPYTLDHSDLKSWISFGIKEVSLDKLFATAAPKRVKLTDTYTAEIRGEEVKIGRQTLAMEKVRELAALL